MNRYREGKQVIGLSGRIRNRTSSFGECIWDCWIIQAFLRASVHCSTETLYMFEKPRLCLLLYSVGKIAEFFLKYWSGFLKSTWTVGWNKPMSFQNWIKDQRHMLPMPGLVTCADSFRFFLFLFFLHQTNRLRMCCLKKFFYE